MRFSATVHRLPTALLVLAALGGLPRVAHASPTYPPVVRDTVGMSCTPQCIICHETNEGGYGTLNEFADNLVQYGLHALDDAAAKDALIALETMDPQHDTDGDGISDLAELRNGDLPAVPGQEGQGLACSNVKYGCGARIAPRRSATPASLALLTAVLFWAGARVRRRMRPGRSGETRNDPCR